MPSQLTDIEARILGSLIEKSLTTPEQYPLSVRALTAACNQKTSREPVMGLSEDLVGKSLFPLMQRGLAAQRFEAGDRVPKFEHCIRALLGDADPKVVAAVCVLLLRGPQTPGEIRTRTERMCGFADTAEVEALLAALSAKEDPIVSGLPRFPGQKEVRYQHLFCGAPAEKTLEPVEDPFAKLEERLASLEERVRALEQSTQ